MKYTDIDLSQNCYFSHLNYKLVHKKSEIVGNPHVELRDRNVNLLSLVFHGTSVLKFVGTFWHNRQEDEREVNTMKRSQGEVSYEKEK